MTKVHEEWREDALCLQFDPELFFPEPSVNPHTAKKICAECPVKAECLAEALANNERFGIWGGLSPAQRLGLSRPPRPNPTQAKVARLKRLGTSLPDIVAAVGVSERQVLRLLKRERVS